MALPALLTEFTEHWSLTLHEPFAAPSYNFVVPATRAHGEPVVLKVGFPNPELTCEIEALRWWDGRAWTGHLVSSAAPGAAPGSAPFGSTVQTEAVRQRAAAPAKK